MSVGHTSHLGLPHLEAVEIEFAGHIPTLRVEDGVDCPLVRRVHGSPRGVLGLGVRVCRALRGERRERARANTQAVTDRLGGVQRWWSRGGVDLDQIDILPARKVYTRQFDSSPSQKSTGTQAATPPVCMIHHSLLGP